MKLKDAKDRGEAKLRYAQLTLGELETYEGKHSNDDWENAHQEAFFFHVVAAVDMIMHEVNTAYGLGLTDKKVGLQEVERKLKSVDSPAFTRFSGVRRDPTSWLYHVVDWRNMGAHRKRAGRVFDAASEGKPDRGSFFRDANGQIPAVFAGMNCMEVMRMVLAEAQSLIAECRAVDPKL